uniref:neurogenic locus notch homolog protein 1-like n=1 Tax=Pristiophorus japonicus TaxID=55135 RepID=UPI00398E4B72
MAPTPPQGEIEADCMDVNVRGPDGFTPLMIASCSGGGLETGNSEEEVDDASGNLISDFIYQGAKLHNQTDRTGETALHLAARYARSDAAKRLLESSANANIQDNMGRTPLHAAVAADAQGVFQILIRNRATDLDARMHDGTTPLILAARLAVEGMVEELVNCHADVNAVDDFGKSALHWAAAVNNVEATMVLLKNGANKDMQDNKEETPLFLAAREGSYETGKLLLEHFANREITDHMDRLPRDIAQDRMHHDIVQLLEEYNLVRSPQVPMGGGGGIANGLSPPVCSPMGSYMGNLKQSGHGKKSRKAGSGGKGSGCKESKAKRKKSQDGKGGLLDTSAVLSPVDSTGSNHTYLSDVASPPLLASPFQQSPAIQLNHLQGLATAEGHLNLGHLGMGGKPELGLGNNGRMVFEPSASRLSQLPTASGQPLVNASMGMNLGGAGTISGQCDWLARMQSAGMMPNPYNPLRNTVQQSQHGILASLHNGLPNTSLSQMISYQGLSAPQSHLMQQQQPPPAVQLNARPTGNAHPLGQTYCGGDPRQSELTPLGGGIHLIPAQDTQLLQTSLPSSLGQTMATTQFLTPPSQHGYSSSMDNTPNHQLHLSDHPFLTPSPESPDQWSSSSPHSNMSDWSEGISSPPTSLQAQRGHLPEQVFK